MATRPRGDSGAFFVATPPSKIEGAIMNKSLLTIIVGLAIAFFSAPSRAGENYIYNTKRPSLSTSQSAGRAMRAPGSHSGNVR
jgi:hypothetical protein